jgi:ribosomal protein S18 acetylase RimI-like enzyme
MHPFVRDRDVLTIAPIAQGRLRVGDIVAFTQPGGERMAVHRLVGRAGADWMVRGDNMPTADGVVPADHVLGRVVRVERHGRDAHLGIDVGASLIAKLSRTGAMSLLLGALRLPRRVGGVVMRKAQGVRCLRAIRRRIVGVPSIVEATDADLEAVGRCLGIDASRSPSSDPLVTSLVAKRDGRPVGFVQYVVHTSSGDPWAGHWAFSLVVAGRYRRCGIGEALVNEALKRAGEGGAQELLVTLPEGNARALALYRKLGFRPRPVPALEREFDKDAARTGDRRRVLVKSLGGA